MPGGRPKGSKNKRTIEQEIKIERAVQRKLKSMGKTVPTAVKQPTSDRVVGQKKDYGISDEEAQRKERCWSRIRGRVALKDNTNITVRLLNKYQEVVTEDDMPLMESVINRARWQFSFFTEHFVWIVDADGNRIPLKLNKSQRTTHAQHLVHLRKTGYGRTIILKARQQGLTTYTNARGLHHGIFNKEAYTILMAVNQTNSSDNLLSIRNMFKDLPIWFKNFWIYQYASNTGDHKDSSSEMQFDSHVSQSPARFVTANANGDGPRGKRANFFHWTETAFCDEANEAFTAITPMIRKRPGAPFIIESTANGLGNWFADQCLNIHSGGLSTFHLVFLPWHLDESNTAPAPDGMELDEDETNLVKEYGLTNDQLYWRRLAIADENGDVNKFNQEYPISVDSAFLTSDVLYFTPDTFKVVEEAILGTDKLARYDMTDVGIVENQFGNITIYANPVPTYEYVLGVDCAEGVGADSTVAIVLDPFGKTVAVLKDNKLRPDQAVAAIAHIAKQYNNAKVVVERGGIGTYFSQALQSQVAYGNLFVDSDGRAGWRQTEGTRKHILAQLQQDLVDGVVSVPIASLLEEMRTFEINDKGKPQHKKGYNDDTILALALTVEAYHRFTPRVVDVEVSEPQLKRRSLVV